MADRIIASKDVSPIPRTTPPLTDDVVVEICRHYWTAWQGPIAKLAEEGVFPEAVQLPAGSKVLEWTAGDWHFRLQRQRTPGTRELVSVWSKGDWWRLVRLPIRDYELDWDDVDLLIARQELRHAVWQQTAEGQRQLERSRQAKHDKRFKAFMQRVLETAAEKA